MRELQLVVDYAHFDACCRELERLSGVLLDKQFGERVALTISLPVAAAEDFLRRYR